MEELFLNLRMKNGILSKNNRTKTTQSKIYDIKIINMKKMQTEKNSYKVYAKGLISFIYEDFFQIKGKIKFNEWARDI